MRLLHRPGGRHPDVELDEAQGAAFAGAQIVKALQLGVTAGRIEELRGLRPANELKTLPAKGDKLFHDGKEVGYVTSAVKSPALNANIALGYVRRESNAIGTELALRTTAGETKAVITELPFAK